jgi:hypothetical protein
MPTGALARVSSWRSRWPAPPRPARRGGRPPAVRAGSREAPARREHRLPLPSGIRLGAPARGRPLLRVGAARGRWSGHLLDHRQAHLGAVVDRVAPVVLAPDHRRAAAHVHVRRSVHRHPGGRAPPHRAAGRRRVRRGGPPRNGKALPGHLRRAGRARHGLTYWLSNTSTLGPTDVFSLDIGAPRV